MDDQLFHELLTNAFIAGYIRAQLGQELESAKTEYLNSWQSMEVDNEQDTSGE